MPLEIRNFDPDEDLEQLRDLFNGHIGVLVPGWSLPGEFIAARLKRNPDQYIVDPWVEYRRTVVGYKAGRLCAAAHILRYAQDSPGSGQWLLDWFLFWPEHQDVGERLLERRCSELSSQGVKEILLNQDLFVPVISGIPSCFPHIREVVEQLGFSVDDSGSVEFIYGGLVPEPLEMPSPLNGLHLRRCMGDFGTRFVAVHNNKEIAECECVLDLSKGGDLPCMAGWAELTEVYTNEAWRNKGVGSWLVNHAVEWLRTGGYSRVMFCVAEEDHAAGAGRFYERFGWRQLFSVARGHKWTMRAGDDAGGR